MLISAHTLTAHRSCTTAVSSRLQRRCATPCHSSTSSLRLTASALSATKILHQQARIVSKDYFCLSKSSATMRLLFRAKLLTIEHRLETEFFSPDLMDMLRTANALNKWDMTLDTAQYKRMYQRIFAIEFSILRIGEYPIPSIIDIVNSIRLAKGNVFAEWKNSETAKLFEDHGYKNKKQSSGFFF